MREIEKMRSLQLYSYTDKEIQKSFDFAKRTCAELNKISNVDEGYRELIEKLIPGIPKSSEVCPPFYCDHGHGIKLGENVFINYGCTMLDSAIITIEDNVKIGPNCQFYTPQHPIDYVERRKPQETAYPIEIGEDTWLGGGVIVCPNVRIGKRCIVAAGSVVIKDVPDDCLVAGNPAVIKKRLNLSDTK